MELMLLMMEEKRRTATATGHSNFAQGQNDFAPGRENNLRDVGCVRKLRLGYGFHSLARCCRAPGGSGGRGGGCGGSYCRRRLRFMMWRGGFRDETRAGRWWIGGRRCRRETG